MPVTWGELAARTLARQFYWEATAPAATTASTIAHAVQQTGPIQSQTARSPFLGLAARLPGVTHATVTAAYEQSLIVRGSNLRGTVHTCVANDHVLLEAAARVGQRAVWLRHLRLANTDVHDLWSAIEDYAQDTWRTPADLSAFVAAWVAEHDPGATPDLLGSTGRYLAFGHGGLIRRPISGPWSGQGRPAYRSAAALLGDRTDQLADLGPLIDNLIRRHLACYGPSSRNDIAWWSGLRLGVIDNAMERLASELHAVAGPDGRRYHDLDEQPLPIDLPGVRLLPEFDALLCAYDPPARARFVDPGHYETLWRPENGLLRAPLLIDGRITGYWRLAGTGRRRDVEVSWFARTRRPRRAELSGSMAAIEAALDLTVERVRLDRC